nr:hypothetical protein [Tanacetum cinerariifolium]
ELAEYINIPSWNCPAFSSHDDDENYTIAITPEEPDNSLKFSDSNDDSTSIDDDYFYIDNIDYIELSPPDFKLVSLEEVKDDNLRKKLMNIDLLIVKIKSLNENPTPDHVLKSPILTFSNHTDETNSGSTTTHVDYSLPKYDSFLFEIEPDQGELISVVILEEPRVHVPNVLTTHPTFILDSDFIPSNISLPESKIFYFNIEEKNSVSLKILSRTMEVRVVNGLIKRCVLSWTAFCQALRFAYLKNIYCVLLRTNSAKIKSALRFILVPEHTIVETPTNMSPENKAHFPAEKEAIHLILTRIGDDIYSIVDACQTAPEMWEAIERLQQGESLNIQDVKTNLFWEFGKFTSHEGETMESNYTRFYKLMNEMIRNNLTVTTMPVNVQFLQQLQPEWSRFVMIVKQQHKLDEVSYHKLFDILKQYQSEFNELRAEKLGRNANPLALVATAQVERDPYYQTTRSHRSQAPLPKPSIPSRSHTSIRHKGKEITKPITPLYETAFEEDRLRTPRTTRRRCCCAKKAEQGVSLQVEQYNWLADTDEEVDEQELEAHYSYMAKIQEVPNADSGTDSELVEHVQKNVEYNVFANDLQHSEQSEYVSNTCLVEADDSNVTPNSPGMCEDDIQNEQND